MSDAVTPESVYLSLKDHPAWVVERARIYRDIRFASFLDAIDFINRVAVVAEKLGHHPNISLHEWCFVRLELYTHVTGGLTTSDVRLAIALDGAIDSLKRPTDG